MRRTKQAEDVRSSAMTEPEPVSLVDGALRVVATRQLFTRDEALDLLHQVEADARDHAAAATVERIVAEVDADSADQLMIARANLVDPLLDIRLVLCPC
jgi:hypothetical protein